MGPAAPGLLFIIDGWLGWLPLAASGVYIGYLFFFRALRFRSRYGIWPIHVPARDDLSAHAFVSRSLVVFFVIILLLTALAGANPGWLESVDPLYRHRSLRLIVTGVTMLLVSGLLVRRAQEDMGDSWRVGIDERERTELISRGLFRFCRNPIYFALQLGLIAIACTVPGYSTLTLLVTAGVLFQVQARLEEAYLHSIHGEAYARYCRRVGRFLPWTGRWSGEAERG